MAGCIVLKDYEDAALKERNPNFLSVVFTQAQKQDNPSINFLTSSDYYESKYVQPTELYNREGRLVCAYALFGAYRFPPSCIYVNNAMAQC